MARFVMKLSQPCESCKMCISGVRGRASFCGGLHEDQRYRLDRCLDSGKRTLDKYGNYATEIPDWCPLREEPITIEASHQIRTTLSCKGCTGSNSTYGSELCEWMPLMSFRHPTKPYCIVQVVACPICRTVRTYDEAVASRRSSDENAKN